MKKLIRLMTIAFVAFVFAACSSSSTPESVTKQYLKSAQDNDFAAIMEMMYFKKPLTKEQKNAFVAMLEEKVKEEMDKKGGIASYEIGEVEMDEDGKKAKVNYTITFGDGSKQEEDQAVILVDGKWMIDSGK